MVVGSGISGGIIDIVNIGLVSICRIDSKPSCNSGRYKFLVG